MKARIITPERKLESDRKKGRELINDLRGKGWSDDRIAGALGVPFNKWKQFLINIGMNPFVGAKPGATKKQ
jgi:hypothetical protein